PKTATVTSFPTLELGAFPIGKTLTLGSTLRSERFERLTTRFELLKTYDVIETFFALILGLGLCIITLRRAWIQGLTQRRNSAEKNSLIRDTARRVSCRRTQRDGAAWARLDAAHRAQHRDVGRRPQMKTASKLDLREPTRLAQLS